MSPQAHHTTCTRPREHDERTVMVFGFLRQTPHVDAKAYIWKIERRKSGVGGAVLTLKII